MSTPTRGEVCGAVRTDAPELPCVLEPHGDDEPHADDYGGDWATVPLAAPAGRYVLARIGNPATGLPMWMHTCGLVEAFTDVDLIEGGAGCPGCQPGSNRPEDWRPLYVPAPDGAGAG